MVKTLYADFQWVTPYQGFKSVVRSHSRLRHSSIWIADASGYGRRFVVRAVEADGIVLRTKSGISKVYFAELPKDVQERFHYGSATPIWKGQSRNASTRPKAPSPPAAFLDAAESALQTANEKFVQRVEKKLDERELILQGKYTPGPAESAVVREFLFHKAFLAGIAIIACVLFAVVWARVK